MPHHKDAIKRMRQNEKRRMRNRHNRTKMRTQIKRLNAAITSGDRQAAEAQLPSTVSEIHRNAQRGIIHPRQAARRVSRLTLAVNGLEKS